MIAIHFVNFLQREVGLTLTPPTGKDNTETWPGLEAVKQLQIKYTQKNGYVTGKLASYNSTSKLLRF